MSQNLERLVSAGSRQETSSGGEQPHEFRTQLSLDQDGFAAGKFFLTAWGLVV